MEICFATMFYKMPAGLPVSFFQFCRQILDPVSFLGKENNQVVKEIGSLIQEILIVARHGPQNGFHGFFPHFLGDSPGSLPE